jgi:hypothetical protein
MATIGKRLATSKIQVYLKASPINRCGECLWLTISSDELKKDAKIYKAKAFDYSCPI